MGGIATYYNICFYPETMEKFINPKMPLNCYLLSNTFSKEIAKENDEGVVSFNGAEQKKVEFILRSMLEEQEKRLPRYHDINEASMSILLSYIIRKVSLPKENEQDAWKAMADYINDNLNGDLSLEALAKKCFYNPSYFSRLFKKKYHVSLVEYVNEKRIEKSIELLTKIGPAAPPIKTKEGWLTTFRAVKNVPGKGKCGYEAKWEKEYYAGVMLLMILRKSSVTRKTHSLS